MKTTIAMRTTSPTNPKIVPDKGLFSRKLFGGSVAGTGLVEEEEEEGRS